MSKERQLIYSINNFLRSQLVEGSLPEDDAESVEIAIQCLESAFNVVSCEPSLEISCGLNEIFQKYITENVTTDDTTPENKALAMEFKIEGNSSMYQDNYSEAITSYTKAINLDPTNPVYYCNRAAAFNNLCLYDSAIQDCRIALKYKPFYHKAYARIGLACSGKHQYLEAVVNYKKALELDPENINYRTALESCEAKVDKTRFTINANNGNGSSSSFFLPSFEDLFRCLEEVITTTETNINTSS